MRLTILAVLVLAACSTQEMAAKYEAERQCDTQPSYTEVTRCRYTALEDAYKKVEWGVPQEFFIARRIAFGVAEMVDTGQASRLEADIALAHMQNDMENAILNRRRGGSAAMFAWAGVLQQQQLLNREFDPTTPCSSCGGLVGGRKY